MHTWKVIQLNELYYDLKIFSLIYSTIFMALEFFFSPLKYLHISVHVVLWLEWIKGEMPKYDAAALTAKVDICAYKSHLDGRYFWNITPECYKFIVFKKKETTICIKLTGCSYATTLHYVTPEKSETVLKLHFSCHRVIVTSNCSRNIFISYSSNQSSWTGITVCLPHNLILKLTVTNIYFCQPHSTLDAKLVTYSQRYRYSRTTFSIFYSGEGRYRWCPNWEQTGSMLD